ncbi:hypothetical protein [Aminipila terrae]|uniref:Uncharacterized protein n=1 Tax=Aminipila terrae TaxID=2697030 RepID=A0A6P1MK96_9FIRM|nr:hypothetical protein [Aminipila terrae]QHI73084.1 hypothetical protein Ami3637_12340 [Aminipila terrae]
MIKSFAPNSQIKMIISEKEISTTQIKWFLSQKGIFSMVQNSEELSNEIYPIFFGCSDIEKLQEMLQSDKNYQKSSIMILEPCEKDMGINEFQDFITDELNRYKSKNEKYRIESVQKNKEGNILFKILYTKKVKGKIELLKDKVKEINVKIEKRSLDNKLIVDIRQNDNSDLKELDIFIHQLSFGENKENLFNVEYITLDKLNNDNKIKFFDDLIAYKYKEWRLEDIKGVDVNKTENLDEDEDGEESITKDELAGINSAVFKGNSIRETGIVQKFLKQGFYFTSMKFKYEYQSSFESFVIDVNFKSTENIKIEIIKTYDKDDHIDRDLICVLPFSKQEEILVAFQNVAYEIYNNLLESQGQNI